MNVGDTVMWLHSRVGSDNQGWAGNGTVRILGFDPSRKFFAPPVGSGNPGPAVHIEIADPSRQALTCWVDPAELTEMPS